MAPGGVVFLDGPGQSQAAFLNQIQQIQPLVLIALGEVHHQAQIGCDHVLPGPLTQPHGAPFQDVVLTTRALPSGVLAALLQHHQRLHLAAEGELLLGGQQLVATNLTEIGTQCTRHSWPIQFKQSRQIC